MTILGIETSCDETSLALLRNTAKGFLIEKEALFSQIDIHSKYGGVVPEVAARAHTEKIFPILDTFLKDIDRKKIDVISVASGPGLITSLLVGVEVARTFSYVLNKPLTAVNHIEAHIYANWLKKGGLKKSIFPALCLVVSGGHTELVLMRGYGNFKIIGRTLDDASGECFDKIAKILNLGYPGGPLISREAENFRSKKSKSKIKIDLPRPMINSKNFDFSFSGLKTAVLYLVRDLVKNNSLKKITPQISFEAQEAITEVLVKKTIKAAKKNKVKTVMLAGGVAANKRLRERLGESIKKELPKTAYEIPEIKYCTDNATMVGAAGYFYAKEDKFTSWQKLKADPNWEL